MSVEQAVFELDLYGFTILPEVLGRAETTRLAHLLDGADAARGVDYAYDGAYARLVANVPAIADDFLPLIDHPAILPVLEAVLGQDILLGSMNSRIVRPGDPAQGLHSDIPAVHRRIIGAPVMVQATWLIDGYSANNGATRIVPGSHRFPDSVPPAGRTIPHVMAPVAPAGSVLIFNGQCWHGGGANESDARRRAIFGHYRVGPWMRFQTDPTLAFPQERWEQMTPRQREIMRMTEGVDQPNAADHYAGRARGRYE